MELCREGQEGMMAERIKETFGVMDMFIFLIVVVLWMHIYLKMC